MYSLHPQLQADSYPICRLSLNEVRLMNDQRFPWIILIPQRHAITEIHQLLIEDQVHLIKESSTVAELLCQLFEGHKINVAALGNLVPQLHWHVVARHPNDPAWPGPVWGFGDSIHYDEARKSSLITRLREGLVSESYAHD